MNSSAEFPGSLRRSQYSPNFWLAIAAGSLALHLLLLLSGRFLHVSPVKSGGAATPIELVDPSPISSSTTTQSTRSAAPEVIPAPAASQRAVSSEAAQRAAPIQPSIVQQPIPSPTPQLIPQIKPAPIKPAIASSDLQGVAASTPKPQPFPSVKPAPTAPETTSPQPTAPQPASPQPASPQPASPQPTSPNPESTGSSADDQPTSPDAASGSAVPNDSSEPPSTSNSGKEPGSPGPIGSDQTLSSELSVESNIGQLAKAGMQTSGKSVILQDSPTQIFSIQFPPALKLTPNQVLDLTVLVVIDNTSGKVLSSEALPESRAFQEIPGLNQDDVNSVISRIFQDLTFKVDVETGPEAIAPQSPWKVPVQIRVIK